MEYYDKIIKAKLNGHSNQVRSVCFSPDGNILASGSRDNSIRLWDIKADQLKAELDDSRNSHLLICFSPDGTNLAYGSEDNSIHFCDGKTRKQIELSDQKQNDTAAKLKTPQIQKNLLAKDILRFSSYLNQLYFKLKELLSLMDSLRINWEQILNYYLKKKEFPLKYN